MNQFTEDQLVEQTVISLVKKLWDDLPSPAGFGKASKTCHINAYKDEDDAKLGREHRGEVVLKKFLLPALQKLNPTLPEPLLTMAMDELTRDRSHLSLVNANHEIYKLLRDGASVMSASESGVSETERVRFFDFKNPENNHFLCVSQLWITGESDYFPDS